MTPEEIKTNADLVKYEQEIEHLTLTIETLKAQMDGMKRSNEKYVALLNRSGHEIDALATRVGELLETIAAKDIEIEDLRNGKN